MRFETIKLESRIGISTYGKTKKQKRDDYDRDDYRIEWKINRWDRRVVSMSESILKMYKRSVRISRTVEILAGFDSSLL